MLKDFEFKSYTVSTGSPIMYRFEVADRCKWLEPYIIIIWHSISKHMIVWKRQYVFTFSHVFNTSNLKQDISYQDTVTCDLYLPQIKHNSNNITYRTVNKTDLNKFMRYRLTSGSCMAVLTQRPTTPAWISDPPPPWTSSST